MLKTDEVEVKEYGDDGVVKISSCKMSFTIPFIISPSKTNVWGVTFHNDAESQGCIYERGRAH